MNSGLNPSDPTVVAAFKAALLHQGLDRAADFPRRRPGVAGLASVAAALQAGGWRGDSIAAGRAGLAAAAADRLRLDLDP